MVTISLKVSDELARRLAPYQDRLPEIVELGLSQVESGAEEGAETNRSALKAQVLAALSSTGITTMPGTADRAGTRIRRTPIKAGGPPPVSSSLQSADSDLLAASEKLPIDNPNNYP